MKEKKKIYVGGQAVIEGVMMRGPKYIATAVRQPSGEIVVKKEESHSLAERYSIWKKPFIRGVLSLYESLVYGMKSLSFSAQAAGEEEEALSNKEIGVTFVISMLIGIGLFLALPTYGAKFLVGPDAGPIWLNAVEGIIRLVLFILYIYGISRTEGIQRVFQYHGAEHMTIYTYEADEALTVDNVRKHGRLHPRCGTNFLLIVMIVSIIVFTFLGWPSLWERIASRVILMPVVAGISYEVIRLAGRTHHPLMRLVILPGLWLQLLTTKEPDDDQIEVAIEALEAVRPSEEEAYE